MTIIRFNKAKTQLQVVTDDGDVFGCAAKLVDMLKNTDKPFILMSRLPFSVSPGRFGKSPIWDGEKLVNAETKGVVKEFSTTATDGLSKNNIDNRKQVEQFKDKVVEFD